MLHLPYNPKSQFQQKQQQKKTNKKKMKNKKFITTNKHNPKKDQSSHYSIKKQDENNLPWIGYSSPTPPQKPQSYHEFQQQLQTKLETPKSKPPAQLIQDILKGFSNNSNAYTVNPYYSQQSQQKLEQILTSPSRLQNFISLLQSQMPQADESVLRNYQMLIILLKHLSKCDYQLTHNQKGIQLIFNKNLIIKQQTQIQKLQRKIKQKDQHIRQIVQQYQLVVRNFNDVILKLLQQKTPQ